MGNNKGDRQANPWYQLQHARGSTKFVEVKVSKETHPEEVRTVGYLI